MLYLFHEEHIHVTFNYVYPLHLLQAVVLTLILPHRYFIASARDSRIFSMDAVGNDDCNKVVND